jgi:predicted transcriptional regulator of viral defense system
MGRPSRFTIMKNKKEQIQLIFKKKKQDFFTYAEISEILDENKEKLSLPQKTTVPDFIKFLTTEEIIIYNEFNFPHKTIHRYVYKDVGITKIAPSLFKGAYLSHHTAAYFHKLTNQRIGEIYINKEQSNKGTNTGNLIQSNITKAFSNNMRRSNNFAHFQNQKIFLLNGKNTGDIGVETISNVRVTSIARTLIDITVRPLYCGGPEMVLEIFKNAKGKFLVKDLLDLLEKINYHYPYHQSIGFYLEKANYPLKDIEVFRQISQKYDFYLTYKMEKPLYDRHWRVYFPNNLVEK